MRIKYLLYAMGMVVALLASCADDDSFSTSPSHALTFSADTVRLDTVFSNVPSAARSLWVYNRSGDGLRLRSVRLERGEQSGFRVNVDGIYLSEAMGYAAEGVEVRSGDSVRVFVELTAPANRADRPLANDDDLVFTLESGKEQRVRLSAYAWDATAIRNAVIDRDSTIDSPHRPIIVYGGIRVESGATLTIAAGTTLYFHNDAGIDVHGRLLASGSPEHNVVLRGDRIDNMFDYLPYDRVPGQWQGIRFRTSSVGNVLQYTDIHSAYDGVVVDSADVSALRLTLDGVTIHNCQGYGLRADNARMVLTNTQITNVLNDCVLLNGGHVAMNHCTLAQFYPFDANRGVALRLSNRHALVSLAVANTLITGYADDMLVRERVGSEPAFDYTFAHSIVRTPRDTTADSVRFSHVVFEQPADTVHGAWRHFVKIDTDSLRYDFALDSVSTAIDGGDAATSLPTDRRGKARDDRPDVGAFEYVGAKGAQSSPYTKQR